MGCTCDLLDQKYVARTFNPEFAARNINISKCLKSVYGTTVPYRRSGSAGFSGKFKAVFCTDFAACGIVAEYQKVAYGLFIVISKLTACFLIFDSPSR